MSSQMSSNGKSSKVQPPSESPTLGPHQSSETEADNRILVTAEPSEIDVPTTSSRYSVKTFHARGGMGEVWVSEDPRIGREVAIKRLRTGSTGAHERFVAEAQIAGQLEHPCIVPVHDMGQDEAGKPYYVMKFVRGKSLKHTIVEYHAGRPATKCLAEIKRAHLMNVFVGICQAVAYAHSRGVLHRDIKPDNIMLGEYGEIVLLDWGLAKVRGQTDLAAGVSSARSTVRTVAESLSHTEAGSVMGSPLYMPPEMAEGRSPDTDERTDIYLLGATLYEILTGRPPREGRSRDELIDLARTARPIPPCGLCKIDPAVEAICLKAMAWRKEDRYPSVTALLDDIHLHMVGEPVSAYREPLSVVVWRWCRKHKQGLNRTAAALVVLALGAVAIQQWHKLDLRRREALLEAQKLQEREQARLQIQKFDRLLDEARFYAASTDDVAERAPYFDPDKARLAEQAALDASSGWGDGLERLPLANESPRLRGRLYELLLLMAQNQLQAGNAQSAQNVRGLLDHAAHLMPTPSRGYHRLRSLCLEQLNDPSAAQPPQPAAGAEGVSTAFDFFLLGEDWRRRAASIDEVGDSLAHASTDRIQNIQHALDDYRRALELDPTHYWAHFQLGRCYLSVGKTSEAVEALGTCVALRPTAPWSYSTRGMALGLLGRFEEAQADVTHALQLEPNFLPAVLNRGAIHWLQNDTESAIRDFTAILSAPEDHRLTEAAFYRSQIYLKKGDLDRALADLNVVLAAQPRFTAAMLLRARVQLLKGNTTACLADLNLWLLNSRGIGFTPHDSNALESRGEILRGLAASLSPEAMHAALELSRQDLITALSLGNKSFRLYASEGAVLELLGDLSGALQAYSLSIQANPLNNQSQINRAWALQKAGNFKQSCDDFLTVIQRDPNNAEAHVGLAYAQACMGQGDIARDEASRALVNGSGDYLILHNVACVFAQVSEKDQAHAVESQNVAISMLRQAIQLWKVNPKGPDELQLIEQEPAFSPALRGRTEFAKLSEGLR